MKQRLQTLLTTEKIASSKFADILGVNRSSISHLLSGRNNPSLDFLQKVLVKFPHINPDWLLLGQGSMYRNDKEGNSNLGNNLFKQKEIKPEETKVINEEIKQIKQQEPETEIKVNEPEEKAIYQPKTSLKETKKLNSELKKLERIVFFYSDNTFDTYYPNQS